MQESSKDWAASGRYRLVDEHQIINYLNQKQLGGRTIQVVLKSGRVFTMLPFAVIAQLSPGGWFKGIIRRSDEHLWGVLLCAAISQFICRRDEFFGCTGLERRLHIDFYLDEIGRDRRRRHDRRAAVAKANGDIRRIRELHADGSHTEDDWQRLLGACGSRCLRCSSEHVSKDHIVPLARGGTDFIFNLQPLCRSCNSWKGIRIIDFRDHSSPEIIKLLVGYDLPDGCTGRKGRSCNDVR